MLKRDTQREGERGTETQDMRGSVAGVIGCVTAQKLMNWGAVVKVLCISKPSHKTPAAGVVSLRVCPCCRQAR